MMHHRPIQERDVILVYLLGNPQTFLTRIQVYLKARRLLVDLPSEDFQRHQRRVENVLEANPDDIQALMELAVLYEVQDELSEAAEVLENVCSRLLDREEDCSNIYIPLGSLYERQGDYHAARHAYEEGEKLGLKLRPAICLKRLPPTYEEFLVCGLSTRGRLADNFDEKIRNGDNGVRLASEESVIRLGFLGRVRREEVVGRRGSISVVRHRRLLKKLSEYLVNAKHSM